MAGKKNSLTLILLAPVACLGLAETRANDHDLDPPKSRREPYTVGPPNSGWVAGGIREADQQVINNQNASPYIDFNQPVDLPTLLNCALELNPTTRQSWRQAKAAAYSLSASKGAYWPTLMVTGGITPKYSRKADYPGFTRGFTADYTPQLQLQYLLFDFGGREATIDSARFSLLASDLTINQTIQTLCAQVATAYYNLLYQEAVWNLTKWQVDIANSIACLTKAHPLNAQKKATDAANDLRIKVSTFADDLEKVLEGKIDKENAAKTLVNDVQNVNEAQKNADSANSDAAPVEDYKLAQTKANVSQAEYLLAAQTKQREAARVQLLSTIGLPTVETSKVHLKAPPGYIDKSMILVPHEDDSCTIANTVGPGDGEKIGSAIASGSEGGAKLLRYFAIPGVTLNAKSLAQSYVQSYGYSGEEAHVRAEAVVKDAVNKATDEVIATMESHQKERTKAIDQRMVSLDSKVVWTLDAATDSLVDLALRRRPDLAVQYAMWKQSLDQSKIASSNMLPTLSLQATASTDFEKIASDNFETGNHKRTDGFGRSDTFSAMLSLSFTAFDGFNLVNKYNASKETLEAARASLAITELAAISDVVANVVNYKQSLGVYWEADKASRDAADALAKTQDPLTKLGSYLDAINAQTALFAARVQQAQAAVNVLAAAYSLSTSTGVVLRLLNFPHAHIPTATDLNSVAREPIQGAALPHHK